MGNCKNKRSRSNKAKSAVPSAAAANSSMVDASASAGNVPASAPPKQRGRKRSLPSPATSPATAPPPNKKNAEGNTPNVPRKRGRPPLRPITSPNQPELPLFADVKVEVEDEEPEPMVNFNLARAMVAVKEEEPDEEEKEEEEQAQQGSRRGRKSAANRRQSMLNVKDEPISRDPSPVGVPGAADGKLKGRRLGAAIREKIETENCIVYPFPRYFTFGEKKRIQTHRRLDLIQDGEVDGTEDAPDVEYTIGGVLAMDKHAVLIDWIGYQFPMWHPKSILGRGTALSEYNQRTKILDPVMNALLVAEPLTSIRKLYPNMTIMQTKDFNEYVHQPGIIFLHGVRKRERQIQDLIDELIGKPSDGGPTLIFEDWTDFQNSSIPTFEYIRDTKMSKAAAEMMKGLVSNPKQGCACVGSRCDRERGCCSFKSKSNIAYLFKGMLGNTAKLNAAALQGVTENAADCVDLYECGDACACGDRCMQRVLQRGLTRHSLVVFKHAEKGWTLWTGNAIKSGTFVCEYTGLMMTAKEASTRDRTYQMDLDVMIRREGQPDKKCTMVLDASDMGNEARFIAHSCEPNLFNFRVHFDIQGRPTRHIGLYASRDIQAGEELTMDYHPKQQDPESFHRRCSFTCKCTAANCREKQFQAMLRRN